MSEPRHQRVIIENVAEGEWLMMLSSGQVHFFGSAKAALAFVKRLGRKGNKQITITQIEWRNVPPGFNPDKLEEK